VSIAPGGLLSVEAARDAVLAVAEPVEAEIVVSADALGRVTAETVTALVSLPPWPNSAMDGYAIVAADTASADEASPISLRVIGDIAAGVAPTVRIGPGTAARIATGARLPDGADAVVAVEATTPLDGAGTPGSRGRDASGPLPAACLVHEAVEVGGSVRAAGSDLVAGAELLGPGVAITAAAVALITGSGVEHVRVHRRPRIAVLATGDEVRAPGQPLGPAGIPDANGPGLRALVTASGGEAIDLGIATDDLDDVLQRLRRGLDAGADAIIVSGGVSVGPYDVVKTAIESVGRIDLWRVAVQPGKPFAFGTAERPGPGGQGAPVLMFGLPGNPVSSAVTFELFVRPALRALAGRHDLLRPVDRAVLGEAVDKSHGRRAFIRVQAERNDAGSPLRDARGRVQVHLAGGQGSHVISALAAADALAIIPEADDELPAGAEVALWWLDRA
jgi:molybdopterin molybdotransferase